MRRVMPQVNARELPDELVHVEIAPQMPKINRAPDQLGQQATPFAFHLEDLVPDPALDVVEFEKTGGYGTSSGQAGALSPSEPVANQRAQLGKTLARGHRRLDDMGGRELRHMREQFDLDVFFGSEVREESAFRHPDLIGENAEGDAGEA